MTSDSTHTEALLPCPFCGSCAQVVRKPQFSSVVVECDVCLLDQQTEAEATAAWNRRTTPTPATDVPVTYGTMTPTIEVVPPHYPLAADAREAVARAMLEWGTPWDSVETGILADAALSALAPIRAAEEKAAYDRGVKDMMDFVRKIGDISFATEK